MSNKYIKEDLQNIRYYFSRKEKFDKVSDSIGKNEFSETVKKYNEAICLAPPKLYDLYISLYVENNTQESLAEKLGYTFEYISRLNSKLVKFFYERLNKKEEK